MFLFIYWLPVLVCLLGARYRDLYQMVPVVLQLGFLLSPILYDKKNLSDKWLWTADYNPIYRILSPIRHSMMTGEVQIREGLVLLLINIIGIWIALRLINRERPNLPFLI